ncbi:PrgI family protein [Catenulispora sp. NL8]|uniref:PrgI family protein n=1 Tax=Catenulispora pinistramenti TaxID=2705254 RepID=A0ABS5KLJ1_9ACTN|nr:SCO6880 family protein [Catenulispora pinistramenti]MBS2546912.1 PrgI family protein [Catenulispora pinistramenti]
MSVHTPARTYAGWQHEKVNFLLGLSGRRAVLVGAAVFLGLQPLASGHVAGAIVFWPLALMLAGCAYIRVAGRTLDEWMITVVSYNLLKLRHKTVFLSGAFAPERGVEPSRLDLPGVLASLRILTAQDGVGRDIAVLHHPQACTYTAVAAVDPAGLGLLDADRAEAMVQAWGEVLASLCTEEQPIARVQFVSRTVPETGGALRSWHTGHLDPAAPLASVMANEALLAASPATCRRQMWLAVSLDARRALVATRAAGGGEKGAFRVLGQQVRALSPQLMGAGITVARWLDSPELSEVIRTGFDPHAAVMLDQRRAAADELTDRGDLPAVRAGLDPAVAGPTAAENSWSSYRHDGAVSVTYAIHAWPISPVYATALASLLADATHRRSFSFVVEPLGPRAAQKAVMVERTKREVGIRLRARTGQAVSASEQVALDRAAAQDAEHAHGSGLCRFTGYLTVTVDDPDELADACVQAEAGAALVGIELRRMYGAQDTGFAMTLPVGLGLPAKRW